MEASCKTGPLSLIALPCLAFSWRSTQGPPCMGSPLNSPGGPAGSECPAGHARVRAPLYPCNALERSSVCCASLWGFSTVMQLSDHKGRRNGREA